MRARAPGGVHPEDGPSRTTGRSAIGAVADRTRRSSSARCLGTRRASRWAGRTITFQLGTQTASAITNANGVASTSLKLNQKNGTYTVSATYAAGGADGSKYIGSSQGTIFKLQAS